MPDKIARAFNRSRATHAVALDICKAFDSVWHAGLLHKFRSYSVNSKHFFSTVIQQKYSILD